MYGLSSFSFSIQPEEINTASYNIHFIFSGKAGSKVPAFLFLIIQFKFVLHMLVMSL
jgi:hypothetical protein